MDRLFPDNPLIYFYNLGDRYYAVVDSHYQLIGKCTSEGVLVVLEDEPGATF
jgi:hypothetical protein